MISNLYFFKCIFEGLAQPATRYLFPHRYLSVSLFLDDHEDGGVKSPVMAVMVGEDRILTYYIIYIWQYKYCINIVISIWHSLCFRVIRSFILEGTMCGFDIIYPTTYEIVGGHIPQPSLDWDWWWTWHHMNDIIRAVYVTFHFSCCWHLDQHIQISDLFKMFLRDIPTICSNHIHENRMGDISATLQNAGRLQVQSSLSCSIALERGWDCAPGRLVEIDYPLVI